MGLVWEVNFIHSAPWSYNETHQPPDYNVTLLEDIGLTNH